MGVRGFRHAERVTGIARPVVPLFVTHFNDTGEQFLVAGRRQIQFRPFFTDSSQDAALSRRAIRPVADH